MDGLVWGFATGAAVIGLVWYVAADSATPPGRAVVAAVVAGVALGVPLLLWAICAAGQRVFDAFEEGMR